MANYLNYRGLNRYVINNKANMYASKRPFDYILGSDKYVWICENDRFYKFGLDLSDFTRLNYLADYRALDNPIFGGIVDEFLDGVSVRRTTVLNRGLELKFLRDGKVFGEEVKFYEYELYEHIAKGKYTIVKFGEVYLKNDFIKVLGKGHYLKLDLARDTVFAYKRVGSIKQKEFPSQLVGYSRAFVEGYPEGFLVKK